LITTEKSNVTLREPRKVGSVKRRPKVENVNSPCLSVRDPTRASAAGKIRRTTTAMIAGVRKASAVSAARRFLDLLCVLGTVGIETTP